MFGALTNILALTVPQINILPEVTIAGPGVVKFDMKPYWEGLVNISTETTENYPTCSLHDRVRVAVSPTGAESFRNFNKTEPEVSSLCTPLPKQDNLESILELANEILLHTVNTVRVSPNNLARSRKTLEEQVKKPIDDFSEMAERYNDDAYANYRDTDKSVTYKDSKFIELKLITEIAKKISVGNCYQMSIVALFKAIEMGMWSTRVDLISINFGNHVIIVIGRELGSDPENYKTWGPTAVVVDTWANQIFKASDIETNLQVYLGTDSKTGVPRTKLFHPQEQQLEILSGNICSTRELLDFQKHDAWSLMANPNYSGIDPDRDEKKQVYLAIVQGLEEFHQTNVLEIKLAKAKTMLELCDKIPQVRYFQKIMLLRDQLAYFIELSQQWCNNS